MNLIGQSVRHKTFGIGTIRDFDGDMLIISFEKGNKKFQLDAFKSFLVAQDQDVNNEIIDELGIRETEKITRQAEVQRAISAPLPTVTKGKAPKVYKRANIAFKCNFCDGGKTAKQWGFRAPCSDETIRINILEKHHVWCSADDCPCRQYLDKEITRKELDDIMSGKGEENFVCYESKMLTAWKASAGIVQNGEKKGRPMRLNQVQSNSLAVLTTRLPYADESERFIFAAFLVDESYEGDNRDKGYVSTRSEYKIELSVAESKKILFWNYYFNPKQPDLIRMGSGLHRYLDDDQAVQILQDIAIVKSGTQDEELAKRFLSHFCSINSIDANKVPQPKGALLRQKR